MDTGNQIKVATVVIIRVIAIILGLWFLFLVRDIVALFFLSVILTATLDPAVDWMSRKKVPRPAGVFIIYLALLLFVALFFSLITPPLVSQFKNFTENLPVYSENLSRIFSGIEQYAGSYGIQFNGHDFFQNIVGNFFQTSGQIFSTTIGVFSFFLSFVVVLSLAFYMLVKEDGMNRFLVSITPGPSKEYIVSISNRIKGKIGRWLAGQLMIMLIIFILDFAALSIFRVPYALVLALICGIFEIVPYFGPIISIMFASLVGFLVSPVTGIITLVILTIVQQIESNIIVPQLMKKVVGLNPIIVILALLIGVQLGGVLGVVLAIPLATSIGVIVRDLFDRNWKQ